MKISSFFKILNKKIEKYNKMATNPFTIPQPITLVWIDDECENSDKYRIENDS
jgi:hypothetical protein